MKNLAITVKKNEEKILPVFRFSDGDPDLTITAKLKDGASLILVGIFFGDKNSSYIFNSDVIHEGTHTKSLTFIRGVFQGKSQFSNDGMVRMIKAWNNEKGKPVKPSFLLEVMCLDLLRPPFGGDVELPRPRHARQEVAAEERIEPVEHAFDLPRNDVASEHFRPPSARRARMDSRCLPGERVERSPAGAGPV